MSPCNTVVLAVAAQPARIAVTGLIVHDAHVFFSSMPSCLPSDELRTRGRKGVALRLNLLMLATGIEEAIAIALTSLAKRMQSCPPKKSKKLSHWTRLPPSIVHHPACCLYQLPAGAVPATAVGWRAHCPRWDLLLFRPLLLPELLLLLLLLLLLIPVLPGLLLRLAPTRFCILLAISSLHHHASVSQL